MHKPDADPALEREINRQKARLDEIDREMERLKEDHDVVSLVVRSLQAKLSGAKKLEPTTGDNRKKKAKPSKSMMVEILEDYAGKDGMQIKDIVRVYNKKGFSISYMTLHNCINELLEEGKVLQANPEAKRYRRYKSAVNTDGMSKDNPPVKSEIE